MLAFFVTAINGSLYRPKFLLTVDLDHSSNGSIYNVLDCFYNNLDGNFRRPE